MLQCDKCGKTAIKERIMEHEGYYSNKHWFHYHQEPQGWTYVIHKEIYDNGTIAKLLCPDCYKKYCEHVNKFY